MKEFFIIEHPTRGVLFDFVSKEEFHFSPTRMRNEGDKFHSLNEAKRVYDMLPSAIRQKAAIRFSGPVKRPGYRLPEHYLVVWPGFDIPEHAPRSS